ncbi:MAG TPA: hypothetical protein VEG30_17575 [Terriglobales bacterium]|nr:hypothetical protein [Terriglobales bacterium]
MKIWELFLIGFCALPFIGQAQNDKSSMGPTSPSADGSRDFRITSSVRVPLRGALFGRAKCDGEEDIYLRLIDAEASEKHQDYLTLPIRKLRPDGTIAGSFSVTGVSPRLGLMDFFVTHNGGIFGVGHGDPPVYVVSFSEGSSPPKVVRLETDHFVPYQIAVFKTGEFLVSGIHGPHNRTPYTAVFDASGKPIKTIYEPEDEDARKRAEAGEPGFRPDYMVFGNLFVVRGDVVLGSDGNAYLLRAGSTALIYVISSTGQVLRKLSVEAPSSGLTAERLQSLSGRLAIAFLQKGMNQGVIQVVDYQGRSIATIPNEDPRTYPGHMACFGSQGFAFLQTDDDKGLHINRTLPQ